MWLVTIRMDFLNRWQLGHHWSIGRIDISARMRQWLQDWYQRRVWLWWVWHWMFMWRRERGDKWRWCRHMIKVEHKIWMVSGDNMMWSRCYNWSQWRQRGSMVGVADRKWVWLLFQ